MKELPQDSWSLSLEQIFSSRFANLVRQRARARKELGNPARRRFQFEPLESRLLLSADLIGDVPQEPGATPALHDTVFRFDAPANAAADSYTLRFNAGSGDLELLDGTTVVASQSLTATTEVVINGEDGWDDSLTLDFGFGGFFSVSDGITYNGGSDGIDGLSVVGGAFTTVTHTATTTGPGRSGEIVYEDGINPALAISYTGLEPLDLSGSTATDLVVNLPGIDDQAILEDDGIAGNGIFQIRSQNAVPTFETTRFSASSASLRVNMGGDGGSFTVASLPDFAGALRINGQAGADTVTFTGSTTFSTLAVSVGGSVTDASGTSLAVDGNATFSGSSITLGDNADDVTDFGSLTFRATGDVKISEDSDTVLVGTSIASTVSIASAGAVVDGNEQDFDIIAASLALQAMGGIGSGDALETFVATLAASNSGESGNIQILNGRVLSIGSVDGVTGLSQLASGSIEATASGSLSVDAAVTNANGGDIWLTAGAAHSNDDADDLTVNANVSTSGGSITLNGNDLVVNESVVSAVGIGSIVVNFGGTEGTASVTLNSGAQLSVVAGLIRVIANDAISVNDGAILESKGSGDITLMSLSGAITLGGILDAGMNDVRLMAPAGGVVFTASSVLNVEVGSTSAGEFTNIAIFDQVTLGGTLDVEAVNRFEPAPEDRILFMTFGSRTEGEFFGTTILPPNLAVESDAAGLYLVYREDNIAPTATIDQATEQVDPTNASPILFTVAFSEAITNFTAEDISFAGSTVGGTLTAVVSGSDLVYTVSVTGMDGVGTVVASIDAGAVADLAGNLSFASTSTDNTVTFDNVAPTVTIDQAAGQVDPTNGSPILFTVVFSEAITGFTAEDISFAGSTVGGTLTAAVSGSDGVYAVSVTGMDGVGTVVASVVADATTDQAGNFSLASTSTDNTVTFDNVAPAVTIDQADAQPDPTNASPILLTVVFSEAITGFTAEDISFAGSTVGGMLTASVSGSGAVYTVSVTGMDGVGTVVASIVADAATDLAGNLSLASTSTDNTVTFDNVASTVTIDQAAGQGDPTNASPILFTVVFSEAITGFTAEDISFAGSTVGGTLTAAVSGSGASYTVSVTGMDGVGTVVASVVANAATDVAGNLSFASTSTDNTVSFDNVAPTATIDQAAGQGDPTNASPILFTVVFSEVITGFTAEDISFAGSTVGGTLTAVVSGSGATYTVTVTGMGGTGTVVASVVADAATDLAGNRSLASTSTDNTVVFGQQQQGPDLVGSVQWDPEDLLIPGDHEHASIVVRNVGNAATHDRVKVNLYASADGVLDASDILLDTDETCGSLLAGASTTVHACFDLPSNLLPGKYLLLAKVDPANEVAESNEENNVALGEEFDFRWMFGNVPGHGRETLTVRDADGTKVSFSLSGSGTGEITVENGEWDLELTGTSGSSVLTILTLGGGDRRVAVDDIHVSGPLWGVIAPTMDLTGTLAVEGALTAGLVIGSATGAVIAAPTILGTRFFGISVKGIAILGDLENSQILIGADLGADGQLAGTGADEDTYSSGNLGDLLITGSMISSDVRVGQDPVDGIFDNGDDEFLGGSIRSITILDEMSDDSSFVASDFPRFAFIDGRVVDPDTDPRFVSEPGNDCTINWNGCAGANFGMLWPFMIKRTCGMNFADFLRF